MKSCFLVLNGFHIGTYFWGTILKILKVMVISFLDNRNPHIICLMPEWSLFSSILEIPEIREIFRASSSNTVWKRYELGLFVFLGLSSHWFPLWSQDGCRSAARATHILSFQQEEKARFFFFLCHCRVMIPFLDILSESTFSPVGLRARPGAC